MTNFFIVNYNTPLLIDILINNINYFVNDARIYIFDNSDVKPCFNKEYQNVTVYDNTSQQIIDFNVRIFGCSCNKGSQKHTRAIQWFINNFSEDFILCDSDIIIKETILSIIDTNYCVVGDIIHYNKSTETLQKQPRCRPTCCYINTPLIKNYGITYYNPLYQGIRNNELWDTGAWLYLQLTNITNNKSPMSTYNAIKLSKVALHFGDGSRHNINDKQHGKTIKEFYIDNLSVIAPEIIDKLDLTNIPLKEFK